jgi:branched-chain amino acid aminotransferase
MWVFLNGRFVPEQEAVIPVSDRGFLYGDALFETMRVCNARVFRLHDHLNRLRQGAEFLNIRIHFTPEEIHAACAELITRNQLPESILRLTLSRGPGERGYSPRGASRPVLVLTLHPAATPDPSREIRWNLVTATHRVPADDALAGFKSANKLVHILARMEAEAAGANEALLLNTRGEIAEAASANIFWISGGKVVTPPLGTGILQGVTRALVLELCASLGLQTEEHSGFPDELHNADGVFLTQSALGVIAIESFDGCVMRGSPLISKLHRAYCEALQAG